MAENILGKILAAVDNTKRVVGKRAKDFANDPKAFLEMVVGQVGENNKKLASGDIDAQMEAGLNLTPMGVGAIKSLFHGGRNFSAWNPATMRSGELAGGRSFFAQGPGLYAGDEQLLAELYMQYGGKDPALLKLMVEDKNIINPSKKVSPEHAEMIAAAEKALDALGLKSSQYGIRNSFLNGRPYNPEVVRNIMADSGIAGFKQDLGNAYGSEFVIFDPNVIQDITRVK